MIAMLLAAQALTLDVQAASRFAQLALKCVRREYPNKLDHVMNGPEEVRAPKALHPSFYGCYDWHSTVHGHWMLVRLLRKFPDLPEAKEIRGVLDENLAPDTLERQPREPAGRLHVESEGLGGQEHGDHRRRIVPVLRAQPTIA